jgi:hypothetical protein
MPEIWLRYGTTDVVLDIKYENLLTQISSSMQSLSDEEIKLTLSNVALTDNTLLVALSGSKSVATIVRLLAESASVKGFKDTTVDVLPDLYEALRNNLIDSSVLLNRLEYKSLWERIKKFESTIFLCRTGYDPLFGFSGTPTILLRNFMPEPMLDAFTARNDDLPHGGVRTQPLKIAYSAMENVSVRSIEVVANSAGIASISYGSITEAFEDAIAHLTSGTQIELEKCKSAIISPSSEIEGQSTLTATLNSLWNSYPIVKENGSIILLAESLDGIGPGAIKMFVEGRLKLEELQENSFYANGLEHLLYMNELRQKYDLGILSTLPEYFLKTKLGFNTYKNMAEALEKLFTKHGKSHRVLVVSDADINLLKPK